MAYVPPHKRRLKGGDKPSPTPELVTPRFQQNRTVRPSGSNLETRKMVFANDASRWFPVGLENDSHLLSALRLEPICIKAIEHKMPLMLVLDKSLLEDKEVSRDGLKSPWVSIAEHVLKYIICSYKNMKKNMKKVEGYETDEMQIKLVAKFGKVLFHGNQPFSLETEKSVSVDLISLRGMKRLFRTNVPNSYMKYITEEVISSICLDFEEQKESYLVTLSDCNFPDYTIICKCKVMKDSDRLDLYKLEMDHVRHFVADISFLHKDLDLRIKLWSKKNLTRVTDDERNNIDSIISSAVIDPSVKGGLRWSIGKDSSGERYKVVGVWHTTTKTFTSPSITLQLRYADRIDFRTLRGEVTHEVTLKMNGILSQLQEKNLQTDLVAELFKENIKLIWDYFLCCDSLIN